MDKASKFLKVVKGRGRVSLEPEAKLVFSSKKTIYATSTHLGVVASSGPHSM